MTLVLNAELKEVLTRSTYELINRNGKEKRNLCILRDLLLENLKYNYYRASSYRAIAKQYNLAEGTINSICIKMAPSISYFDDEEGGSYKVITIERLQNLPTRGYEIENAIKSLNFMIALINDNEHFVKTVPVMDIGTSVSRFMIADEINDYIIPAIQLNTLDNKGFKVHIGVRKDGGEVACFCGQHHKQKYETWQVPSVSQESNITCSRCIMTMRNLIRANPDTPFEAVMNHLGVQMEEAKTHTRQVGTSKSSVVYSPGTEELNRLVGNPLIADDTDTLMEALCTPMTPVVIEEAPKTPVLGVGSILSIKFEVRKAHYSMYIYGGKCTFCCFKMRNSCPTHGPSNKLLCSTIDPGAFFVEVLNIEA